MQDSVDKYYMAYNVCPVCGKIFEADAHKRVYCSKDCKVKGGKAKDKLRQYYKRLEAKKVIEPIQPATKHSKPSVTIEEVVRAASDKGMTYGKYVALYLV